MDNFNDLRDDEFDLDSPDFSSDFTAEDSPVEPALQEDDEFERLRRSSARSETMYDDLSEEDLEQEESSSGFSMSNFTPGQRLVLAILVVLNILMIGFGLLVVLGIVGG